jgi:hypothetical protein
MNQQLPANPVEHQQLGQQRLEQLQLEERQQL